VLHKEYAGRHGFVVKTIKSRRIVRVQVFGAKEIYDAYPENVKHIKNEQEE